MNREKILFVAVLVITVLWGGSQLASPYQAGEIPSPRRLAVDPPDIPSYANQAAGARFLQLVAGVKTLAAALPERGRTVFEPHSDLLPVLPAVLDLPRGQAASVVMPPLYPFPGVAWYPHFRVPAFPLVTGGPAEEADDPFADDDDAADETEAEFQEKILREREEWVFVESDWDSITLSTGVKWYGRISLKKEQLEAGYTKFDLLLPENRNLLFYFEKLNTGRGTFEGTGYYTLDGSDVAEVGFTDTIENRYWKMRTEERVDSTSVSKLLDLARAMLEICEQEGYDRAKGLELAVNTVKEALAAEPGDLESVLLLGECLHRSFRFNEEFERYTNMLEVKNAAAIHARIARIYRKLGLDEMEEQELTTALELAPGDTRSRLARAEARFRLGRLDEADEDFGEVAGGGTAEEMVIAREGRARVLLVKGDPAGAEAMLAGTEDLKSLVTLGAALYAGRDFEGALEAFARVVDEDPEMALAMTNLGFAQVQTAATWEDLDQAMETLDKARDLAPLNYFFPPLGQGFAEARRGRTVESVDRFAAAAMALPTDPYVHYILGVSYLRDQRFRDARDEFLLALKLDYRFLDALIGAGEASLGISLPPEEGADEDAPLRMDWEPARDYLGRVVTMERRRYEAEKSTAVRAELINALYRHGRAILLSGDMALERRLREAEVEFKAILELDPEFVPALNAMGYIVYGKREVQAAYRYFDQVRLLAPAGDDQPDRVYAVEMKQRILDAENRRIWRDSFDRRNGTSPGNGWLDSMFQSMRWLNYDGEARAKGRWPAGDSGVVWLTRGDNTLNNRFISFSARVRVPSGHHQMFRAFVYTKRNKKVAAAVGFERNARGEVVFVSRTQATTEWVREVVKDEDGTVLKWPSDLVSLRVARVDHKKGVFEAYFNGRAVGKVDVGIRKRPGPLFVGFTLDATNGEEVEAAVDEVELEIYVQ